MVESNLEVVRRKVESLHYAVMKIAGKHFLKINRLLVETERMDESGTLWLTSNDALPNILIKFMEELRWAIHEKPYLPGIINF